MTIFSADWLASAICMMFVFFLSLSVHEFAHALTATLLGDNTPKREGRLTLNPLVHVDIIGLLCLVFFRFGWARPVNIDARNFSRPILYELLTAFAGPLANFIMALAGLYIFKLLPLLGAGFLYKTAYQLVVAFIFTNIGLGVFNLLPIPPLDGGHVLTTLLDEYYPQVGSWVHEYSFFILILFLLSPFSNVLRVLSGMVYKLLCMLVII